MSASNDNRCTKWLEICFKIKYVKEEMLVMFIITRNTNSVIATKMLTHNGYRGS